MPKPHTELDATIRAFIEAQRMFFVATAPAGPGGHINLSPKGLDTLRIFDARTIAYLDHVGSGAETIAHLRENGRIVFMFCAFEGAPKIVRVHGTGNVVEAGDPGYSDLRRRFPSGEEGRSVIRVSVERVSDSCGFGVPLYAYQGQRNHLAEWEARKGEQGLLDYQREKNRISIDGLPALKMTSR